ncbi:MAG TPA: MFS transporter, partial [Chitinophagales bacterium]|nr:MFS transporter [Chitinophagales bacterium]
RELAANSTTDSLITTTTTKAFADGTTYKEVKKETVLADKSKEALKPEIKKETKLPSSSMWFLVLLVGVQVLFVTMVYGPIAAFLVELFPTRIRYSSMSLPYHIGNGVFGGLTPFIATRLYEASKTDAMPAGDPLSGLWYPIVIAGVCFVIGSLYLSNKIDENVAD